MDEQLRQSWERFLNPETLRSNLIVASIFLAAHEILRQSIIERIRDFFTTGFDSSGFIVDPKYQAEVLSKNRSPIYASLEWLKESHAIDEADVAAFDRIRQTRNEIAHEITQMLTRGIPDDYLSRFHEPRSHTLWEHDPVTRSSSRFTERRSMPRTCTGTRRARLRRRYQPPCGAIRILNASAHHTLNDKA
jgi:hypothetical protein